MKYFQLLPTRAYHIIVLGAAIIYAILNFFIQDDAYISFRYVHNFASGHGFTFNHGEYVEGYTNFLWTLLLGCLGKIGLNPESITFWFGMVSLPIVYFLFHRLASYLKLPIKTALLASIALFLNFSFSSYVTGGLETQLQTVLLLLAICIAQVFVVSRNIYILPCLSFVLGLLILNRLDSVFMVSLIGLYSLYFILKHDIGKNQKLILSTLLILPGLLIIFIWIFWKFQYYGDILPNTFYAKIGGKSSFFLSTARGVAYISFFIGSYFLIPNLILVSKIKFIYACFKEYNFKLSLTTLLVLIISIQNLYFIYVGGDFMEFRFQTPLLPIYMLLAFAIASKFVSANLYTILFVISSLLYSNMFRGAISGFESIPYLENHINGKNNDWKNIGLKLKALFGDSNTRIAISPAGAIPYYSELYSVDMLGLNDKWIAKHGTKYKNVPGHNKIAPLHYLKNRNVNLIIGHPLMIRNDVLNERRKGFGFETLLRILPKSDSSELINHEWTLMEIPINNDYTLVCWYLIPSKEIEMAISKYKLTTHQLHL